MPPPFALKADLHREDNPELDDIELTGTQEIGAALQAQLATIGRARGGSSVDEIVAMMEAALVASGDDLLTAVTALLTDAAAAGIQAAGDSLVSTIGLGASMDFALADAAAADFVRGYAFDLVTGINNTTSSRLRGVMVDWIEKGGTLDDLTAGIRPIFANEPATARIEAIFNVDRARMIAETEATRAYAQGKVVGYQASGLADFPPEKVPPDDSHVRCRCDVTLERQPNGEWHWIWLTARDELVCPICAPLDGQSVGLAREAFVVASA